MCAKSAIKPQSINLTLTGELFCVLQIRESLVELDRLFAEFELRSVTFSSLVHHFICGLCQVVVEF